jgi:hypothetical protein
MRQIDPELARLEQRAQGVMTLMIMMLLVLLVQLWLLTIALEEYMAARTSLALPTFGASLFCFLLSLVLLKYLYDLDRR